jgi:hypothetical protein
MKSAAENKPTHVVKGNIFDALDSPPPRPAH